MQEIILDYSKWENNKINKKKKIVINNNNKSEIVIRYSEKILLENPNYRFLKIRIDGTGTNAGGYINVNSNYSVPIGATSIFEVNNPSIIELELVISAESSININNIEIVLTEKKQSLLKNVNKESNVLIVVPNYPSYINLYYCAFAHSRNVEYQKNGLNIQVASISNENWYQTEYEIDNVPVFKGNYEDLKELLKMNQYKVIIAHFVDEKLFSIYDKYISKSTQLIFICHGPETLYRYLPNVIRPYFSKKLKKGMHNDLFDLKDSYIKKYSQKDNVEWCFVSDWLKNFSEQEQKLKFKHCRVINNLINEKLFPYHRKRKSDRKKILIIRKFDNIIQHSIDQSVLAILELSKRDYFNELQFNIYGDGNYFDTLLEPIKNFKNVNIHRTFIPNKDIHKIHQKNGILLLPSRHDAHAVAMGEGASSGLVVVGSNVTSNGYFMDNERNHTMTDPENPIALANVIDRLYHNPKEFLDISKRLSSFTRTNCCKKNTVNKEIELIKEKMIK